MGKNQTISEGQGQKEMKGFKTRYEDKQVYIILLLVTFAFLILSTPGYIFFIVNLLDDFTKSPKKYASHYLHTMVAQYLQLSNYGINFFLYVISGKKFRKDLLHIFRIGNLDKTSIFSSSRKTIRIDTEVQQA